MDEQEMPEVPTWTADVPTTAADPSPVRKAGRRRRAGVAIVGSLLVGGAAGAALFGPLTANAASPSASPSTAPSTSGGQNPCSQAGQAGLGGPNEAVTDTSVVAKAIGLSEPDLVTALQGGQTVAQVATAHDVAVQKVIDALVADGLSELADQVKAGTITQAQADAQKAAVTQRATNQVNGTLMGGPGGQGGFGGFGGPNGRPAPSANP